MFDEDLDAFTSAQDFGVPVSFAGAPACLSGIENFEDETQLGNDGRAPVVGRARSILLRTDVAARLKQGQAITVNGVAHVVRTVLARDDGAFSLVALR